MAEEDQGSTGYLSFQLLGLIARSRLDFHYGASNPLSHGELVELHKRADARGRVLHGDLVEGPDGPVSGRILFRGDGPDDGTCYIDPASFAEVVRWMEAEGASFPGSDVMERAVSEEELSELFRSLPPGSLPGFVGDPFDDLIGNEIFDRLAAYLETVAPCDIRLFMRQGNRMVYHVLPRQREHLSLIKEVIAHDRKFLDTLDIDQEDVGLADGYIRISVPR
jgi:hypothetical protein